MDITESMNKIRDIKKHPHSVIEWIQMQKAFLEWAPKWDVIYSKSNKIKSTNAIKNK